MGMLFLLTGLALAIFAVALAALVWSVRSGQYDDLETPGVRMLLDDRPQSPTTPSSTPVHHP